MPGISEDRPAGLGAEFATRCFFQGTLRLAASPLAQGFIAGPKPGNKKWGPEGPQSEQTEV